MNSNRFSPLVWTLQEACPSKEPLRHATERVALQDYEKVAKAFVNEPDVVIAKIDADGNRVKGNKYGVTGFPTIKWFPKDNKEEPMAYELSRSVEAFVEFINDHAGTKRNPDGRLKEDAGRIEELDALAVKFVDASEEERSNILKQVQEHIDTLSGTAKE